MSWTHDDQNKFENSLDVGDVALFQYWGLRIPVRIVALPEPYEGWDYFTVKRLDGVLDHPLRPDRGKQTGEFNVSPYMVPDEHPYWPHDMWEREIERDLETATRLSPMAGGDQEWRLSQALGFNPLARVGDYVWLGYDSGLTNEKPEPVPARITSETVGKDSNWGEASLLGSVMQQRFFGREIYFRWTVNVQEPASFHFMRRMTPEEKREYEFLDLLGENPKRKRPDLGELLGEHRYIARFQPEEWRNEGRHDEYAAEVGADGEQEWEVTDFLMAPPTWANEATREIVDTLAGGVWRVVDRRDVLREDPAAPAWIKKWTGPFTITVRKRDTEDVEPNPKRKRPDLGELLGEHRYDVAEVVRHYLMAAAWTATDPDTDEPIIKGHGQLTDKDFADIRWSRAARKQATEDVKSFLGIVYEQLANRMSEIQAGWDDGQMGHDFHLSRNGHGAGFFDRGPDVGRELQKIAETFGETYVHKHRGVLHLS